MTAEQLHIGRATLSAVRGHWREAAVTGAVVAVVAAVAALLDAPAPLLVALVAVAAAATAGLLAGRGTGADGEDVQLHRLAHVIRGEADKMTSSLEQLSVEANSISFNSMMQTGASEAARESLSEISTTVQRVAALAGETESRSRRVSELAAEGEELAQSAVAEMDRLSTAIARIEQQVTPLVRHSAAIGISAELIRRIASQTKLLSLNATIEAVRAGDRGAGFAVVAEEVRKLSDESSAASLQITSAIAQIQEGTSTVAAGITDAAEVVHAGLAHVSQTFDLLAPIRREAADTLARNSEVVRAVEAEVGLTSTAVDAVNQVLEATAQTDVVVNQALATSLAMSEATDGILTAVAPWTDPADAAGAAGQGTAGSDPPGAQPVGAAHGDAFPAAGELFPFGSGDAFQFGSGELPLGDAVAGPVDDGPVDDGPVDYAAMYGIDLAAGDPFGGDPFAGDPFGGDPSAGNPSGGQDPGTDVGDREANAASP